MSQHRRNIALFVLLLVCLRGALVLSLADVFGYGEEFAKGTAAKVMFEGLGLPHYQLNYGYHEGGGFVVSHIEALLFLVMGPCVMALKVCAVLFSVATLLAGAWLVAENVSSRAACIFAALFVFQPESFQRISLLSLGTHVEATLLILLAFIFTLRIVRNEEAARWSAFWLGIVAGFGCYFSPQILPALAASLVVILARVRGRKLVDVIARGLAGFALGALPLWWMLSHVGVDGVLIHRQSAAKGPGFFASLPTLFAPIVQLGGPIAWAQAILFAVAIVSAFVMRRSLTLWLCAAYLIVYVIGYGMSGLAVGYDAKALDAFFRLLRLVPPWIVVLVMVATGIDALWSHGGIRRVVARATVGAAIFTGIQGLFALAAAGKPSTMHANASVLMSARGYSYQEYFVQLEYHFEGTRAEKAAVLLRSRDDPALLVPDVANALYGQPGYKSPPGTTGRLIEHVLPELTKVFGPQRDLALLGVGATVNGFWNYDVAAAFAKLETLPEDVREPLAEGLGRNGLGPRFRADKLSELFAVKTPDHRHDAWWRGVGWRVHQTFRLRPDLARATLAQLPEADRVPATVGFERALQLDRIE